MVSALLLTLAGAAPCGPIVPAESDPKLAAVYVEVGEAELRAQSWEAAAIAFSKALAHDPSLTRATSLREQACLSLGEGSLSQVKSLMEEKRWAAALALLMEMPGAPAASRALLEGVCLFELGRDADAKVALERAVADPLHEDEARVLLSLIALRRGSARAAEAQLRALEAGGRTLGAPLSALLRQATRGGSVIGRASIFGGVEFNPAYAPMGMEETRGLIGFTALGQWVPLGAISPYLRLAAGGREYPGLSALRSVTGVGTAGFQLMRGGDRLAVDYGLEGIFFGTSPYAVTHGPRVEGSLQLGSFLVYAEWMLRFENFLPSEAEDFSGARHEVAAGVSSALPLGFSFELGWGFVRDDAREAVLALLETGPRLAMGWGRERTRVTLLLGLDWRSYDAYDDDLGVRREDVRFRPSARVEYDFTDWLSGFVAADASVVRSNVEAVTSVRFATTGGLQLWVGAW